MGARFDDRVTGKLDTFAPEARVLHLDIDPAEHGKRRRARRGAAGRPGAGAARAALATGTSTPGATTAWRGATPRGRATTRPATASTRRRCCAACASCCPSDAVVTCDVGQHQMWVAQHGLFSRPEHHLSSGGLGTMGFGLPAAIGAQLARPDATVVTVSGDGSFLMNVQELATVARYALPVKILVVDNQALGMVRQWQSLFFDSRLSEVDLSDNPDFGAVARAFRVPAFALDRRDQRGGGAARVAGDAWARRCSTCASTPAPTSGRSCRPTPATATWWRTPMATTRSDLALVVRRVESVLVRLLGATVRRGFEPVRVASVEGASPAPST